MVDCVCVGGGGVRFDKFVEKNYRSHNNEMHVYMYLSPDHRLLGLHVHVSHEQYYDNKTPNY